MGELTKQITIRSGACITALGNNISQAWAKLVKNESGLSYDEGLWKGSIASLNAANRFDTLLDYLLTDLEKKEKALLSLAKTGVIISSAKANITKLSHNPFEKLALYIKNRLLLLKPPTIISNACISGVCAINLAGDMIREEEYETVIVIGIDVLSEFVEKGFSSLHALSKSQCKPYDNLRDGINLGEAAAYVVLSGHKSEANNPIVYVSGASSNDSNHISGPSKNGEGLYRAIRKSLDQLSIKHESIDYIQAHGTATIYNDEMEAQAFHRLRMSYTPINSFKSYIGHTLGAAGIVETQFAMKSMLENTLIKSLGYTNNGLTIPLNLVSQNKKQEINTLLKSASGFGGGNAALILQKKK